MPVNFTSYARDYSIVGFAVVKNRNAWCHDIETLSWAFLKGIYRSPVDFLHKVLATRALMGFYVSWNLRLNKRSRCRGFQTSWRSLWRYFNGIKHVNTVRPVNAITAQHVHILGYTIKLPNQACNAGPRTLCVKMCLMVKLSKALNKGVQ